MTTRTTLFELRVIVEADGWYDVSALVDTVDRALEPHRTGCEGGRQWSVVASPLPVERADELLWFIAGSRSDDEPGQLTA